MRVFFWWTIFLLCVLVSGYSLFAYTALPLGNGVHPEMKVTFEQNRIAIYTHVFASIVALILGPLQFSSNLRLKYIQIHRWFGRAYLAVGVLCGGLAGVYMAQHAFGGLVAKVGFSASGMVWIFTGCMALYSIFKKDVEAHKCWMIRNFSIAFSAVTLRVYLVLFTISDIPFHEFYPVLAWLSWVPNILLAEWILNTHNKALHRTSR